MRARPSWISLAALVVTGCGGSAHLVPVGWVGTPGECSSPRVVSGTSAKTDDRGYLVAHEPGTARYECERGVEGTLDVRAVSHIVIDGPMSVSGDDPIWFDVVAIGHKGERLPLDDGTWLEWEVSGDNRIDPGYCHEPIFTCPEGDSARVWLNTLEPFVVTVRFGQLEDTHRVIIIAKPKPHRS